MRSRIPVLLAAMALFAGGAFAAGCGGDDDDNGGETTAAEGALNTIEPGKLIVGSDIPYAPFQQGRAPDYLSLDIDLVKEIGKRLGLTVEVQDTSFDTIFRDLAQGKFDMVASSTTITPEREKTVSFFSDPYYLADQSLMVKKGSDITTVDDVAGKTVSAQREPPARVRRGPDGCVVGSRTYGEIGDAFKHARGRAGRGGDQRLPDLEIRGAGPPQPRGDPGADHRRELWVPVPEGRLDLPRGGQRRHRGHDRRRDLRPDRREMGRN